MPLMDIVTAFLAREAVCNAPGIVIPITPCAESSLSAVSPREPGDDDDIPTDPAWLAEFNALIGRPQPAEEPPR